MILSSAARWSCPKESKSYWFGMTIPSFLLSPKPKRIPKCSFKYHHESIQTNFAQNIKTPTTKRNLVRHLFVPSYSKSEHMEYENSSQEIKDGAGTILVPVYKFCRPYACVGTVVSTISASFLPLTSLAEVSPAFILGALKATIPFLFCAIFVIGINQIYDVEIDKINKPDLPLASGTLPMKLAVGISSISMLISFGIAVLLRSPVLFNGIFVYNMMMGTVYSMEVPFLRWKSNPFLAAIVMMSTVAIPITISIHIQKYVLGGSVVFTRPIIFSSIFTMLFSVVAAMLKDIPDIKGDQTFGINSFTAMLGKERVFWLAISILMMACGSAMGIGASSSFMIGKIILVLGHFFLACILLHRALSINLSVKESAQDFYMFIWKLYYAELLLIHFSR